MSYTTPPTQPLPSHYFGNVTHGWVGPGVIVPQAIYSEGLNRTNGAVVSFQPGIPLTQALHLEAGQGFDTRPVTTPLNRARFTLRLLWPGYSRWQANINARERTPTADPIPMHKLMRRIAESVQNFYAEMRNASFNNTTGAGWHLNNIPFERLYLLELRQVSDGSWQPVLSFL